MAKKLLFTNTFTPSENKIVVNEIVDPKRLLLITNVTTNQTLFMFNTSAYSYTSVTPDYDNYTTTIVVSADCSTMSSGDAIQVFIENDTQYITPAETFTDPVSKIRVSQPENLIDTDFEYGLQSTKWETLELTNNIPTFFSRSGDIELELVDVTTENGSNVVTVTTSQPHGFQRGAPIIMVGTSTVTCDGGFVVNAIVDSTTFTYICKSQQTLTTSIIETYTQLFPGSIYSGTEFKLANIGAITTDGATPSTLTVNTEYPTNFTAGTSMVLSNTYAKADVTFDTDDVITANEDTIDQDMTSATATGETNSWALGGVYAVGFEPAREDKTVYFEEGSLTIDTVNNRITFPSPHPYNNLDEVVYACDTVTNTPIGGLVSMRGYWVRVINATTIELRNARTTSTANRINLTSNGVSGGVIKSAFVGALAVASQTGGTSDTLNFYTFHGFSTQQSQNRMILCLTANGQGSPNLLETTTVSLPGYNSNYDYYGRYFNTTRMRVGATSTGGTINLSNTSADVFVVPIKNADSIYSTMYFENHGLLEDDLVTYTTTTGTTPGGLNSGATYRVRRYSDNRIGFKTVGGSSINFTTFGSSSLVSNISGAIPKVNADTISVSNNTFSNGDALTYSNNSGTDIGGLTDGTTYYVARKTGDRFNLATTSNPLVSSTTNSQSSSLRINTTTNQFINNTHGFSTGDALVYTTTGAAIPGLRNGGLYYGRAVSSTSLSLHPTAADATANTNIVNLGSLSSGSYILTKYSIVDLTSVPSPAETHTFTADFTGAADGIYEVSGTNSDQLSFTLGSDTTISSRELTVVAQEAFTVEYNGFYVEDHGLITGDSVLYTESGSNNITGLTDSTTYYAIRVSKDIFRLATTQENALAGTAITLTETGTSATAFTGTLTFQPSSIVGNFAATGTVSYEASSTTITGEATSFTSYFNSGDTFLIAVPPTTNETAISSVSGSVLTATAHGLGDGDMVKFTGTVIPAGLSADQIYFVNTTGTAIPANNFTVHYTQGDANADTNVITVTSAGTAAGVIQYADEGSIIERTVDYVNSDFQLTVTEALPATAQTDVQYLLSTSLLLRSDGFALHRPYDGGVELIPSSNPDSQMIRQTRKYFRYQSGKGIQVSFAVNFSPTSQIDTFTRSGSVATITTRFPHRLTPGLNIVTSGSTNTDQDTIGTKTYEVTVDDDGTGQTVFFIDGAQETSLNLLEGRTYRFTQEDSSNSGETFRFSTTEDGTHGGGSEYTTGVTVNGTAGTAGAYTEITVADGTPDLYVYAETSSGLGFAAPTPVDPADNKANLWNGTLEVLSVVNDLTFTVQLDGTPSDNQATGLVEYYVAAWSRSSLKCGLFDDQNGIFFEYDGSTLYVARRSSIRQLSGYASVEYRSGAIAGVDTKFASQLTVDDYVVIKGQTHKINRIDSDNLMYVSPSYRGVTADKVIITKVETTKIQQSDWNLDTCDGTGPTGFQLNINRIQMAYVDYSWYGAGKVRFGFKDQHGDVKYVHEFVHGNFFTEAYMRSGNLPARYEIQNNGAPSYVPALAHWGTSVIMDGRFDNDKAYVFNANSNNVTVTGSTSLTVDGKIDFTNLYYQRASNQNYLAGYAILLDAPESVLNSVTEKTPITGANLDTGTVAANPLSFSVTPYQPYLPSVFSSEGTNRFTRQIRNLLLIDKQPTGTSGTSSTYTIGTATGADVARSLPLISIRLAPSVDTSTPGFLGEREIINRMQLILDSVGILSTHAAEIQLIFNGQLNVNNWQRVTNPSLSQLLLHTNQDTIVGGQSVFNFRVSGGTGATARTPVLTTQDLGEIATLGNAILGGDGTYPDGPDVLTVVATLTEDPSTVSSTNPFIVSGRISWSESQA